MLDVLKHDIEMSSMKLELMYTKPATTIQKFPYIVDSVAGLKKKRFAVIIEEAHSSTAGKDMAAVTMSLGTGNQEHPDEIG